MFVLAGSFIFCISSGLIQILALMVTSAAIGISITKNHYVFFALEAALVLAVLSVFYAFSLGINGFISGVTQAAIIVMLGSALGISTNVKMSLSRTIIMCSMIYLADFVLSLRIASEQISFSALFNQMRQMLFEIFETQYGTSEEMLAIAKQMADEVITFLYKLMPAYFVIGAGIFGIIITFVFKKLLPIFNKNIKDIMPMSSLRGDKMTGIAFVVICILGFSMQSALMADAFLNIIFILCFMLYLYGMSYIDHYMKLKGKKAAIRSIVIVLVIPLATLLFAFPLFPIMLLGFIDCFADFRKKQKKEGEDGPQ